MQKTEEIWVSASDIGRANFCPHYLELKKKGAKPTKKALHAMAVGDKEHLKLNKRAQDTRCYVATYLYGPDDYRTHRLRNYRDNILLESFIGRALVQIYYALSPWLVIASKKVPLVRNTIKGLVDRIVNKVGVNDEC